MVGKSSRQIWKLSVYGKSVLLVSIAVTLLAVTPVNVSDVKVICMEWQQCFVNWTGFNIVATYGPPEGLSLADANLLINTGKEENVTLVIDNLQSGTILARD